MKLSLFVLCGALILSASGYQARGIRETARAQAQAFRSFAENKRVNEETGACGVKDDENFAVARYTLDASRSSFMVRTFSGGLLFFKGHDHFIAIRDFKGEAQLTPTSINPASLEITVRADSLAETRDVFTEQQKQIINKEIRELVLETAKYPEIVFKSTNVTGKVGSGGQFEARIAGDLTLHGVTHKIVIPALVSLDGRDLRAKGEFTIKRGDYNVKATSAKGGTIRLRDKLKFTFDIVAHQI
ncbi:MAG: YceI family protein [Pyrinomonadaceae bacterium]